MITRISGLVADRPSAASAKGARYYATDEEQVYFSTGTQWLPKNALEDMEANGQSSGANLAARPEVPADTIGFVWTDEETGKQYEAFPTAWALVNDLTPGGAMGVVIHGADDSVARTDGYPVVTWIGTIEPTNMADGDIWLNTTPS